MQRIAFRIKDIFIIGGVVFNPKPLCFPGIFAFFPKLLLLLQLYLLGGIDVSWAGILLASLFKIIFPNVIDFPFLFVLKTPELNQITKCITQIHNVKNTPIYFIVAGSPVQSPAQLWVSAANPVATQAPAAGLHSWVCVYMYTTSSSSNCCLPLVPIWRHGWGSQQPLQHCRPPTALAKDHMVVDAVEPCDLSWADFVFLLPSRPGVVSQFCAWCLAPLHPGHSTFQGTLACEWRSFHTEASSYSLEEVTAASSVQTAMQGCVQWKC